MEVELTAALLFPVACCNLVLNVLVTSTQVFFLEITFYVWYAPRFAHVFTLFFRPNEFA